MKKVKTMVMMAMVALMAVTTFSSCRDESIASTLDGVWRGYMYSGREVQSEIEFRSNGAFSSSGDGFWADYYRSSYKCNHINWTVRDGNIYVHFVEENTDIVIYHYTLNDRYFDGTLDDGGYSVTFRLNRISAPRNGSWENYDYYDYYDSYGYTFNQSKGKRSDSDVIRETRAKYCSPSKK